MQARRKFGGHLALAAAARVLIADYPLAPKDPFPADVEATTRTYRWLIGHDHQPSALAVAGESSGGGLVLSTLLTLRDAGEVLPAGAYLMSPWADLTCSSQSHQSRADVDLECTTPSLLRVADHYRGGHDPKDPIASPIFSDLGGLPSLFVQVGGDEILLDDAVSVARNAGIAGTPATLEIWPGMQHFFQVGIGIYPEAGADDSSG